jgi:hypothetical protein
MSPRDTTRLLEALLASAHVAYTCNARAELVHLSQGYRAAAQEDGGPGFLQRWGSGAPLLQAIDGTLRPFYSTLHSRALAGEVLEHEYQCPTPERDRRFRLRLVPVVPGELVAYEHTLVVDRELVGALALPEEEIRRLYVDAAGFIGQCGHCRKVRRRTEPGRADWVPALLGPSPYTISYTLCSLCLAYYYPHEMGTEGVVRRASDAEHK